MNYRRLQVLLSSVSQPSFTPHSESWSPRKQSGKTPKESDKMPHCGRQATMDKLGLTNESIPKEASRLQPSTDERINAMRNALLHGVAGSSS